jgi:hypothetical protein
MKLMDFVKALGIAILVFIAEVLIAFCVVYVYVSLTDPGHTQAFYVTTGVPIARWSTRIVGTALIFGAAWLFGTRRPMRNAWIFAVSIAAFCALLNAASAQFAVGNTVFGLTIGLKLAGGLVGAWLAVRTRNPVAATT